MLALSLWRVPFFGCAQLFGIEANSLFSDDDDFLLGVLMWEIPKNESFALLLQNQKPPSALYFLLGPAPPP